jgi:hypothetical protein
MNEGPSLSTSGPQDFNRFVPSLLPASCFLSPASCLLLPALSVSRFRQHVHLREQAVGAQVPEPLAERTTRLSTSKTR